MGYEVLDVDGGDSSLPSGAPPPAAEIVSLDDLPDPRADEPDQRLYPRRPPPAWLERLRDSTFSPFTRTGRLTRRAWVLVAVATVVGLVAGATWTGHHADQVRTADERAALHVVVTASDMAPAVITQRGRIAESQVRVYNVGQLPVEVVTDAADSRPRPGRPTVRVASGTNRVEPGDDQIFSIQLLLDCSSLEPPALAVDVRTADGSEHPVVARELTPGSMPSQEDLCRFMPGEESLSLDLTGTLAAPELRLANNTDRPMTITVSTGSPLTQAIDHPVSIRTRPRLPVQVPARGSTQVRVLFNVANCPLVTDVTSFAATGYLELLAEDPQGQEVTRNGVDLSPIVGAAVARACT